ncbi:MAG: hypothetical protein JWP42_1820 [Pseudomonas sp.]|nr:hypothetical protein [Pseudomonas sp.]
MLNSNYLMKEIKKSMVKIIMLKLKMKEKLHSKHY